MTNKLLDIQKKYVNQKKLNWNASWTTLLWSSMSHCSKNKVWMLEIIKEKTINQQQKYLQTSFQKI